MNQNYLSLKCKIKSVDYLNSKIRKVVLSLPQTIRFFPGQYLEVIIANGKKCPFSIACAPAITEDSAHLELHIAATPASEDSRLVEELIDRRTDWLIEIPKGECYLKSLPTQPLLLIAASTGITQMKSMLEFILTHPAAHPVYLYWGVVNEADFYLNGLIQTWQQQFDFFHYTPVVSEAGSGGAWTGRTGLLYEVVMQDFDDLSPLLCYISGSPGMVYGTFDALKTKGLNPNQVFSDVFSYSPRN